MSTGNIEVLRRLRAWHYAQAVKYRESAQVQSASHLHAAVGDVFGKRSSEHLRFVQELNEFFPATDRIV